jgi:hypothetical protein
MSPEPQTQSYLGAVRRFWWVILLGIIIAIAAPLGLLYKPKWPPTPRSRPKYSATTELLLNSTTGPFLRTQTTLVQPKVTTPKVVIKQGATHPRSTGNSKNKGGTSQSTTTPTTTTPPTTQTTPASTGPATVVPGPGDASTLIKAANIFPEFIMSDEVAAIREKMIGPVHGAVTANALFASQGVNRYRPGSMPVIEITAISGHPEPAIRCSRTNRTSQKGTASPSPPSSRLREP